MRTNSRSAARFATAIWIALLLCLSAGCGKPRTEYLTADHKLTRLSQGQPAPREGVLISENYLAEIYQSLGQPKPKAEVLDSNTAPAAPPACPTCPAPTPNKR